MRWLIVILLAGCLGSPGANPADQTDSHTPEIETLVDWEILAFNVSGQAGEWVAGHHPLSNSSKSATFAMWFIDWHAADGNIDGALIACTPTVTNGGPAYTLASGPELNVQIDNDILFGGASMDIPADGDGIFFCAGGSEPWYANIVIFATVDEDGMQANVTDMNRHQGFSSTSWTPASAVTENQFQFDLPETGAAQLYLQFPGLGSYEAAAQWPNGTKSWSRLNVDPFSGASYRDTQWGVRGSLEVQSTHRALEAPHYNLVHLPYGQELMPNVRLPA